MRLRGFLLVLLFGLVGCGPNVSPEDVEAATKTLFNKLEIVYIISDEIEQDNMSIVTHTILEKGHVYNIYYYHLDDDAKAKGFHEKISDEYASLESKAICTTKRTSIVFFKTDYDYIPEPLDTFDTQTIQEISEELGCDVEYFNAELPDANTTYN